MEVPKAPTEVGSGEGVSPWGGGIPLLSGLGSGEGAVPFPEKI